MTNRENYSEMLAEKLHSDKIEVGCDEAGRGCLAGPVFAAAVILPDGFRNEILNDSKKINEKNRNILRELIEQEACQWAVAKVDHHEIDEINVLNASILAMHRALEQLDQDFEHILVDGNKFKKYKEKPHSCIIKGDGKFMSIAAASILAKTHRDEYMLTLHEHFPMYEWNKNKGYPTKNHRAAIVKSGQSPYHRQSFGFKTNDLQLNLFN